MDADRENWLAEMRAAKDEPLHKDLQPYVEQGVLGTMLRHPLVYQVPLTLPGMANKAYAKKRRDLDEALAEQDWFTLVWLHERAYRTWALIEYVVGTDEDGSPTPLARLDQEERDLAADVWIDSENLGQHTEEWDALLREADGLVLASEEERAGFEGLPETLTVYRAGIDDGGWSWTLDPKVAVFFAKRFDGDHPMITGTVAKTDVIGYFTRRSEAEVLVPEGKVHDVQPYTEET